MSEGVHRKARRRGAAFLVGVAVAVVASASVALAVPPRGDANYVAVDKLGRPAITLWMRTRTDMIIFACYRWGSTDHGDHYNNLTPITVKPNGSFSYSGLGYNLHGKKAPLKLVGRFVTKDEAVGILTAPCFKTYAFTARIARG
jgi:hypothetical protein